MSNDVIALAADHAGYALKELLKQALQKKGLEILDLGTDSEQSVDYSDFGHAMGRVIEEGRAQKGVVLCGSGIGISIAANRNSAVRAALCSHGLAARLARRHNDANVLAMGARMVGTEVALDCLEAFLETEFEGGRHQQRVDKL